MISGVRSLNRKSHDFSLGGSKTLCRPLNLQSKFKRRISECMFALAWNLLNNVIYCSSVHMENVWRKQWWETAHVGDAQLQTQGKTYLCFTVVTVSDATLVAMFFAATSRPVHMVANPGWMTCVSAYCDICYQELPIRTRRSTLHSTGSHHHGSVYVGAPILVLLHGIGNQLAPVFLHVRRQLSPNTAGHGTHPVHCSNTALLH